MATGHKNRDGEVPGLGDRRAWKHWGDGYAGPVIATRPQVYDPDTLAWRDITEDDFGGEAGAPGGGGTEYTEGDTDATITGTAAMWEDGSNTLRAVSAAKPLPIEVINAEAMATTVTVLQGGQVGWVPAYNNLVAATGDPSFAAEGSGVQPGDIHFVKMRVPNSITISQIALILTGSADVDSVTAGFVGIYDSNHDLINITADVADDFEDDTTPPKLFDLTTAPQVITGGPDEFIWFAVGCDPDDNPGGAAQGPTVAARPAAIDAINAPLANAYLTGDDFNLGVWEGGYTGASLPASFDPIDLTLLADSINIPDFWFGLA